MQGAVLREIGKPLEINNQLNLRAPQAGEVRVAMRASGVCHSDLSVQNGIFDLGPTPVTLGHEGAGEVVAVGPDVKDVAVGDHVILVWLPPCGSCKLCLHGQPQLCNEVWAARAGAPSPLTDDNGEIAVGFGVGAFAEETVVPAEAVVVIDKSVPFDIAALVGCGVMTGVGAVINAAKVEPGASVAVIGAGGVGINVIQAAKLSGATTIVAIDRLESKLNIARKFGATHVFPAEAAGEAAKDLTAGAGFDYVFEVVGRSSTIRQAWDLTRRGGTTVIVGGGSSEDIVEFNAGELFSSERKLIGSIYGSADVRVDFHRVLNLWKAGLLDLEGLVSNEIELKDINSALEAIRRGEAVRTIIRFS